jgi:hypothetical protein
VNSWATLGRPSGTSRDQRLLPRKAAPTRAAFGPSAPNHVPFALGHKESMATPFMVSDPSVHSFFFSAADGTLPDSREFADAEVSGGGMMPWFVVSLAPHPIAPSATVTIIIRAFTTSLLRAMGTNIVQRRPSCERNRPRKPKSGFSGQTVSQSPDAGSASGEDNDLYLFLATCFPTRPAKWSLRTPGRVNTTLKCCRGQMI